MLVVSNFLPLAQRSWWGIYTWALYICVRPFLRLS